MVGSDRSNGISRRNDSAISCLLKQICFRFVVMCCDCILSLIGALCCCGRLTWIEEAVVVVLGSVCQCGSGRVTTVGTLTARMTVAQLARPKSTCCSLVHQPQQATHFQPRICGWCASSCEMPPRSLSEGTEGGIYYEIPQLH